MSQLDPTRLRSLYRLTLRAISASVLNQPTATRNLRFLYRPIFEDVVMKLAHSPSREWKDHWTHMTDETLELLYSSAVSKCLAHKAIRNMSWIVQGHLRSLYPRNLPKWDSKKPPERAIIVTQKGAKLPSQKASQIAARIDYGLGEVIKLAECSGGITLGRLRRFR
ncbi:uncharacterized protein EI90DRAFT_3057998 [Cantharellus anzutake]|uniref:uncharacterized protein n=1 Tax=Cantharellus anzutake TaxID=1750568 RepID=UPI0019081484|nr:uncharacterized protein EI90DRAFT_3057998 [Cantharellus anzutake]KAF8331459.1 hypothetical protein EI90DRAFT_3057998 [Cantharellus anzutake]